MVRLQALFVVVLVLGGAGVFAAPAVSVASPFYEVSIPAAGVTVHHVFTLQNRGDQTLEITDVQPSCACTTATPTQGKLAPGASLALSVSVDTAGFTGLVVRTVTVESNDPASPRLMLVISVTNSGESEAGAPRISARDFQKRFFVLVDVRTPQEFASGHLLGAVNIPLSELRDNLAAWVPRLPKDVPLILQCKSGVRSAEAARLLLEAGFKNVLDLDGGITGWTDTFGPRYLFGF